MPGFNKQGPMGQGRMTGRKMGCCTNFGAGRKNQTTSENTTIESPTHDVTPGQVDGRGMGRGLGRGMGRNGGGRGMGIGRQNRFQGEM